jgi:hypothetical protein
VPQGLHCRKAVQIGLLWAILLIIAVWQQQQQPEPSPPRELTLEERICSYDWDCATALDVFTCESQLGQHPDTYNVDHEDGGVTQLNKATWGWWFLVNYGWTWEMIVLNDDLNLEAAHIVYHEHEKVFDEPGWEAWSCYD